jgi:cytochrome bd ubiquinol oxidase subunit II
MTLPILWFCLIGVLWAGYFVLEGFDFGVGALLPWLARDREERQDLLETIGPVWDGNEVWLVVAGAATFAAFPAWYGTMFSGFYLALLLILVLLILRVVSFEWATRGRSTRWQSGWQWANTVGSVGAPFVWGVALSNLLNGVPLDAQHDFAGNVLDLFRPYTLLGGLATVLLFMLHGATFLCLRTEGEMAARARAAVRRLAWPVAVIVCGFLGWTVAVAIDRNARGVLGPLVPAVIGGAAVAAVAVLRARGARAFALTAVAALALIGTIFTGLYPRVLVSHPDFAKSLTIANAATSHYALAVMTVVAAIFTPLVLLYQGWTYHVFRARVSGRRAIAR